MKIKIRKANIEDAEFLADNNIALAFESEELELDKETVILGVTNVLKNHALGFYLIAEINKEPVASLMITKEWSDWRNGMFWWIQSVFVLKDFRRNGVYSALYSYLKKLAYKDPVVKGFRLYVEKENLPAIQTYRNLGMEETDYRLFEENKNA